MGGQQSELHLPDRIPPPIGTQQNPQQPPQGQDHPPGFEPSEQQQTAISNDQSEFVVWKHFIVMVLPEFYHCCMKN